MYCHRLMEFKDRLKQARKAAGLSQTKLAKAVNLTQAAIQSLESGRVKSTTHILPLANALNIDPIWLLTGSRDVNNGLRKIEQLEYIKIPVFSDAEVLECAKHKKLAKVTSKMFDLKRSVFENTNNLVAYELSGDAMVLPDSPEKSLFEGDIVIIEWGNEAHSKDLVLALVNDEEVRIRQLVKEGQDLWLKPYNPAYPRIKLNNPGQILGTVKGAQRLQIFNAVS